MGPTGAGKTTIVNLPTRFYDLDSGGGSGDTLTEAYVQEAMLRPMRGRTSSVVAHRLSTIRRADMILVANDGQILERGTHQQLLAERGFHYDLYMSQSRAVTSAHPNPPDPPSNRDADRQGD